MNVVLTIYAILFYPRKYTIVRVRYVVERHGPPTYTNYVTKYIPKVSKYNIVNRNQIDFQN